MISPLTRDDDTLAAVATDLADRLFPELPAGWQIGAFQHLTVLESRLLFLGSGDCFEIGRVSRLAAPGADPLLVARVWADYAAAVSGHGILVNFLGLCRVEDRFILIDERLDPATDPARAVIAHEIGHAVLHSLFPPHAALWRERMRRAAEDARALDLDDLACLLDKGWKSYRPEPDAPPDSETPDVYLADVCGRWTREAARFKITLSDGVLLSDWLAMRKAAAWGPEHE
jgi:hypothetical protein